MLGRVRYSNGLCLRDNIKPTYSEAEDFDASCTIANHPSGSVSVATVMTCAAGLTRVCYNPWVDVQAAGSGNGMTETEARQAARRSCVDHLPSPASGCSAGDYLGGGISEWPNPWFSAWKCN